MSAILCTIVRGERGGADVRSALQRDVFVVDLTRLGAAVPSVVTSATLSVNLHRDAATGTARWRRYRRSDRVLLRAARA